MASASSSACSDGSPRSPRSTARLATASQPPRTRLAPASHPVAPALYPLCARFAPTRALFALTLHLALCSRQGGRAEAAGLQTWDRIKSVNGAPLSESRDMLGEKRCL